MKVCPTCFRRSLWKLRTAKAGVVSNGGDEFAEEDAQSTDGVYSIVSSIFDAKLLILNFESVLHKYDAEIVVAKLFKCT